MSIFWAASGVAGIPAELVVQHSLDGFCVFLCCKHDQDLCRVQCTGCVCTGRSFSSVKWMKAQKMNCIPRALSKEHAGKSLGESAVTPRCGRACSVPASLSIQLHCPWLAALETGKKKKSVFRKLGLNRPQELSIYLRQPGQGK